MQKAASIIVYIAIERFNIYQITVHKVTDKNVCYDVFLIRM